MSGGVEDSSGAGDNRGEVVNVNRAKSNPRKKKRKILKKLAQRYQ